MWEVKGMKNMGKWSKVIVLLMVVAMVAALMTGCTATKKTKLDEIKARGYIIWGTNAEFPPFESKDASGKVVGVDADIAKAIADSLGVTLKVEDMAFDSLPAALASGKIDFIGAGFTKNDERAKSMDFTKDYYTAKQVVVVKAGSAIKGEADLKKAKIGCQNGTTGDLYFASEYAKDGAKVERYNSLTLACQDLKNGKIDAVIGDNLPIALIMGQIEGLKLVDAIVYDSEMYALAVNKGEAALLAEIDKVLGKLITDGTITNKLNLYSK